MVGTSRMNKSTFWSLTINNPTAADMDALNTAAAKGWKVEGQEEMGKNGTKHFQIALTTPGQARYAAVKKVFTRAHIEPARNPVALHKYVHKEETRTGDLPPASEMYPSMSQFQVLLIKELVTKPWDDKDGLHCDALELGMLQWYRCPCPDHYCKCGDPFIEGGCARWSSEDLLELLDQTTRKLVMKGYHVEHYAVNPSFRSSFKKFGPEMLARAFAERLA